MSWGQRLDEVIAALSPEWGARRRLARAALVAVERLGPFTESRPGRLDRSPTARGSSADYDLELARDRRQLVERARLADDTNLVAGAILDRSVETVVGEGFPLQAQTDDPAWNTLAEELWSEWGEHEADSRRLNTWNELLALHYRSGLRDGDGALVMLENGSLRSVESDEIADPKGGYTRPDLVDGVELDKSGRPVAFHIFDPSQPVLWADRRVAPSVRVPAENVIFYANRKRTGQTRGITNFRGMFWLLDQVDGTLEAVSVATRMAACVGLVIKRAGTPFQNLPTTTDGAGNTRRKLRLEPGGVMGLEPGEDVVQVAPAHPTSGMLGHIRELERLCTARFPVTLEMVLGDYTASNYSNTRNARLEARERAKIHQARLARICTTVYLWKLVQWMESGRLPVRPDALKHRWLRPAWAWVDPITELQAAQAAVDSGLSTRTIECARLGYDFEEDVVPQLAKEQQVLETAGVPIVRSTLTRDPAPRPSLEGGPDPQRKPAA